MRHMARRKKPKLNSFTNKNTLLHSKNLGKSTYFYKRWLDSLKSHSDNLANDFRWSSRHCEQNSSGFRLRDGANPTRSSREKKSYSKIAHCGSSYILPVACSLALLLVMGLAINPMVSGNEEKVYAAYEPVTSTTGVSLLMETSDALEQQTQVANGVTAYRYNRFKVNKGTDIDKYQVLVQAANGYDSTLVGAENGQVVNAVSGATKGSAMNSAWGYSLAEGAITNTDSLANLEYQALPGSGSTNTSATPYTETKEFTLAFAANIKDKPADHYQTNVLLSVAAGVNQIVELGSLPSMQAMKPDICSEALEGDTARLKDERDGKYYWVAKLKDGNCWMTQNLALDLSTTKPLTSVLTDIPDAAGSWTPENTTLTSLSSWNSTAKITRSYSPGSYVYTTPNSMNSCASTNTGLSACTGNGWRSTSGLTPSTDPSFYKNNYDQVVANGYYDAHYLSGNYYSWAAATAGQAASITGAGQATQSICPKGWRLPYSNSNTLNKSFGYLLTQYGVQNKLSEGNYDIRLTPLYFVYAGSINNMSLNYAGSESHYWSSTAKDADFVYSLNISGSVSPSSSTSLYDYRFIGNPVRCVAR